VERHDENALIIYTDGSCLQRPRRGGYAFRFVTVDDDGHEVVEDFNPPGFVSATNNEMELMACVEALRLLGGRHSPIPRRSYEKIVVYTDSRYVHENVYQAECVWPVNDWLTREQEPVLHPELWRDLIRHKQGIGRVEFRKVKAHKTNPHNKAVDKLAKESARLATQRLLSPPIVRRKTSPQRTEARSVVMRGQTETIRVVTARDIRRTPNHVYKYEVVAPDSPDFLSVDEAFAHDGEINMRPQHTYEVRFAEGGRGRWVEEVIREIDPS
jgi:ribonuclease HI